MAAVVTADSPPSSVSTQGSVTHPHPAASSSLLCMGRPSPKLPPLQRRLCVCACMRPVCTCSCVCALGSLRHFYTYLVLVYSQDSLISHPLARPHVLTWTPPPIFLPTFTCVLLPSLKIAHPTHCLHEGAPPPTCPLLSHCLAFPYVGAPSLYRIKGLPSL